jgi:hypothetical protein
MFRNDNNIDSAQYGIEGRSRERYGIEGIRRVFSDPTATRVVMIRDPLARFASTYMDKCFHNNCSNGFCFPRNNAGKQNGEVVTFQEALTWILGQDVDHIDNHWRLQSEQCNLRNHINEYTIIGRMEKETVSSDAACIMERAGIERFNQQNETSTEPFWKEHQEMKVGKVHYRSDNEVELLKKLFSPEMARNLIEKFRQDYVVFRLPEPEWIWNATGEWLDSTGHHACSNAV